MFFSDWIGSDKEENKYSQIAWHSTSNGIIDDYINEVKILSPKKVLPTEYVILISGCNHQWKGIIENFKT